MKHRTKGPISSPFPALIRRKRQEGSGGRAARRVLRNAPMKETTIRIRAAARTALILFAACANDPAGPGASNAGSGASSAGSGASSAGSPGRGGTGARASRGGGMGTGAAGGAADANGYTAENECRAGAPVCNVDVVGLATQTCQQTITTADSAGTIDTKINGGSQYICVEPGDYTGKGTLTLSANGTSAARKVLRYKRTSDTDDEPWNQSDGNKAKISQIEVTGDYWVIHRLTLPSNASNGVLRFSVTGANNIINRILLEGPGGTTACQDGVEFNGGDNNALQNSVVRDLRSCTSGSPVGVQLSAGSNLKVVNNEVYNWCEHTLQIGYNSLPMLAGTVVENNDLYTSRSIYDGNGDAPTSAAISVKVRGSSGSPVRIVQNRIWGTRKQNSACGDAGDSSAISSNGLSGPANEYVLIQNNTIADTVGGVSAFNPTMQRHSIIGNIFYDIADKGTQLYTSAINFDSYTKVEVYLNTFIYTKTSTTNSDNGVLAALGGQANSDIRCNVFVDSNRASTDSTAASTVADRNVFYGATPFTFNGTATNISESLNTRANSTAYSLGDIVRLSASPVSNCTSTNDPDCFLYRVTVAGTSSGSAQSYCTTLGCRSVDGTMTVQAIRGAYSYYRNLRTGAVQAIIPYARMDATATEATACPTTFADRDDIGISNQEGFAGIFDLDLTLATRVLAPGALEIGVGAPAAVWRKLDRGRGAGRGMYRGVNHHGDLEFVWAALRRHRG